MDMWTLNLDMEHFMSSGLFLTTEEQLLMQTSLPVLQMENGFLSVNFWGKILTMDKNYYVAQGHGKDFIRNKKSFYSLDGQLWRLLYPPSQETLSKFHLVRTRFYGDPTAYHLFLDVGWEESEKDKKAYMKEEDRLSALVKLVDYEAAISPRGAYCLSPEGVVVQNHAFRGLSLSDAEKISYYLHLRLPDGNSSYVPDHLCAPCTDKTLDFLEPISRDFPAGCWTIRSDLGGYLITLRNLWWPGLTFYHLPGTSRFGSVYIGYGERNDDLPFML